MLEKRRESSEEVPWKRGGYFVKEKVAMNLLDREVIIRESCLEIIDAKMK